MTREELIKLRINFLWDFHKYVIDLGDEDIYEGWVRDYIPDEPDDDDMREIAEDDDFWTAVVKGFADIVSTLEFKGDGAK